MSECGTKWKEKRNRFYFWPWPWHFTLSTIHHSNEMPVYLQRTSHMVHAYRKTKCMCMCYTHTHTPHTSNACYCGFSMYVNWTDYRMHVLGVSFWPSAMPLSGCQRLSFLVYFILHSHCLPLSPPYRRSRARARSTWIPWLGLCNDISVCVCVYHEPPSCRFRTCLQLPVIFHSYQRLQMNA